MLTFHHSGTSGDLLSSLPAIKYLGGGKLYLHLFNIGSPGRMNATDLEFLKPLLLNTGYITEFRDYRYNDHIDYNLDQFRMFYEQTNFDSLISSHFLAIGCQEFLYNKKLQREAYLKPFLKVDNIRKISGKYIGVSRTSRHRDGSPDNHYFWQKMIDEGLEEVGLFFGLPSEHKLFEDIFNVKIEFVPTENALELAEYIAGVECFICSASMNYWIATGLQKTTMLETRQNHPLDTQKWSKNECNNHRPNGFVMPFKEYRG